jgi:hypothetical protein
MQRGARFCDARHVHKPGISPRLKHQAREHAVTSISARINVLSRKLMAIAATQTEDVCEAHHLTHVALLRILRKDPELEHFTQICTTLDSEGEVRNPA